jgi:hypothetical protein
MARARLFVSLAALACVGLGSLVPNLASPASAQTGSQNIADYIRRPGDQVVVVPDGTYRASAVRAPHPATDGPYNGWLVLRAESQHGVVVDLEDAELKLEEGTSRVLFVGFKFVNGSITVEGNHIAFWYTDHSFPAEEWARQGPESEPERGTHRSPDTVHAYSTSTRNVRFLGADLHDTGDALDVSNSTATTLEGVEIYDLSDGEDGAYDPNDVVHVDAIDGVTGSTTRLTVRDSWIRGRIVLQDGGAGQGRGGPHRDVLFQRTWVSDSPSAGFIFSSSKDEEPYGIFGRRVDVRSWGHNAQDDDGVPIDRLENINGRSDTRPNVSPDRVNVIDIDVTTEPPPPDMRSPSDAWRARNPYGDWARYFEFRGRPSDDTSFTEIAAFTGIALLVLGVAFFSIRRRRRRPPRRPAPAAAASVPPPVVASRSGG